MSDGGKGSDRRAAQVSEDQAAANWAATFGETWLQRKARLEREAKENDTVQESEENNTGNN